MSAAEEVKKDSAAGDVEHVKPVNETQAPEAATRTSPEVVPDVPDPDDDDLDDLDGEWVVMVGAAHWANIHRSPG